MKQVPDVLHDSLPNGKFLETKRLRKRDLISLQFVFVDLFIERCKADPTPPSRITIDLDGTEDPAHGNQQQVFFNGHYDTHCYLPMIVTATVDDAKRLRATFCFKRFSVFSKKQRRPWLARKWERFG